MTFNDLDIAEPILKAICNKGYSEPTSIQQQAIPVILEGKDIIGIAQTGTGKTAAFAIPIIQHLTKDNQLQQESREEGSIPNRRERKGRQYVKAKAQHPIKALILTPTRELALQISDCFADYGKHTNLTYTAVFGGVKQRPQTDKLRCGVDVLIATPGRLLDLIGQGEIKLNAITHFVLDEADRMLDMGFIGDVRRLLPMLPKKRQTLFFSATFPQTVASLSRSILHNPERIEVTPVSSAVDTVEQNIYYVERPDKKGLLISVLKEAYNKSVLVFSRTKHGADNIAKTLKRAGIKSEAIHGDKSQAQRQKALSGFKSGKVKVMVATDIAARGIDIKELQIVINYDLPDAAETYVHRIGRTGRAGQSGVALTFCSHEEYDKVKDIQKLTGKKLAMIPYSA